MIIKKKLIIAREVGNEKRWLTIDEGDNFEASFDIDSIGGTLSCDLPYIKTTQPKQGTINTLTLDRLRKFDFVYLFYAEVDTNREPKPEEWNQIFNGYIESVSLQRTKDSISYSITANSMLALSNYYYTYTAIEGGDVPLMPFIILQTANMQAGVYNKMDISQKNIIPIENVYVNINEEYGTLVNSIINPKNCKEAIAEYKNKYGLIFTEHMDGMIEVSTLTNHLSAAGDYEIPYAKLKEAPTFASSNNEWLSTLGWIAAPSIMYSLELSKVMSDEKKKAELNKSIKKATTTVGLALLKIGGFLVNSVQSISGTSPLIVNAAIIISKRITVQEAILQDLKSKGRQDAKKLVNALKFDITTNVWNVTYPDVSTEYDCVVVYGLQDVGKAIDMTALTLKNIQPDPETGIYQLNTLKLYRKDIASGEFELNKIAREELYKIKQENRIRFQTVFSPIYRVGMPFTFNDNDRYTGNELFICTKISYTINKDDVNCVIEGMSSFLTEIPEAVINNLNVADVTELGIKDKIIDEDWDNSWQ